MLVKLNEEYLEQINDTYFAKTLKLELPDEEDRLIFVHLARQYVDHQVDLIDFSNILQLYDGGNIPLEKKRQFTLRRSALYRCLVDPSHYFKSNGVEQYRLTDFAKYGLLSGVNVYTNPRKVKSLQSDMD